MGQAELHEADPFLHKELEQLSEYGGRPWTRKVKDRVHRSWHFTRYSLLLLAFSVVPVVGPIVAFLGQVGCEGASVAPACSKCSRSDLWCLARSS